MTEGGRACAGARRLGTWLAVGALLAAGGPLAAQSPPEVETVSVAGREYAVRVGRHHGYAAARWSALPAGIVRAPFHSGTVGTALVGEVPLQLRAGSPFIRLGDRPVQMANTPYLAEGDLWVPLELFGDALLQAPGPATPPATGPAAASSASADPGPLAAPTTSRRPGPWRVTIDAGHGGHDPGTISPRTGAREKDITLSVARRLHDQLARRPGIEPHLTRDRDVFIRVADRPRAAMAKDADLFISIHVNAEPGRRPRASGFETYYLGRARTEESRRVAMRENAVIELEEQDGRPNLAQLEFILAGLDRDVNLGESRLFAGYVQNGLRATLGGTDRGVKSAPFYVLLTTGSMPTVLVELGFITNPGDEQHLTDDSVQDRMARALADAIENYFAETGKRIATMEGRG